MVRNDRRTRLLPKIILGQLVVATIISCIALILIFFAEGYRFDFASFKIVKTGVLYLEFQPADVTVKWNDESEVRSSNLIENLSPGLYIVSISKPDFVTWHVALQLASQSVNDYNKIILFRSQISVAELSDQNKIALLLAPTDVLASNAPNQLLFNDHEIWVGNQLITRFAAPIKNAIWYPDLAHIVYQQDNQIRVIELSGQNDTSLVTLSSETSTIFSIGNRGTELYFKDGDSYKIATIR